MEKLVVPKFATDAEEADWWDQHMDVRKAIGTLLVLVALVLLYHTIVPPQSRR